MRRRATVAARPGGNESNRPTVSAAVLTTKWSGREPTPLTVTVDGVAGDRLVAVGERDAEVQQVVVRALRVEDEEAVLAGVAGRP